MSFFKLDTKDVVTGFELVAEGKYEATVVNAVAGLTNNKDPKITVDFEIRSDVPQEHQGAKVLYNVLTFQHEYAKKVVNSILKAAGFPNNQQFSSPEDMANQLINKNMVITVKHEESESEKDGVKKKSVFPKARYFDASAVNPPAQAGPAIQVGDSDLPF